jgi:hypothetical protein
MYKGFGFPGKCLSDCTLSGLVITGCIQFSGEMEIEHLNDSSTFNGLVEQCRRDPSPTRKIETPLRHLFYACYASLVGL